MNKCLINVSFIIIEFNSVKDVIRCVNSLTDNCRNLKYEIIVSSNSQYDIKKQNFLVKTYPEITWSFNEKNGGFAYGMNRGIEKCQGEYIVLQNPDTTIENSKLSDAIDFLQSQPNIGILGPQVQNNASEIQDTCRSFVTPLDIVYRFLKRNFCHKGVILNKDFDYNKIQFVDWVIGAFMITSRKNLEKVGLFNERFFMYVEDMELCLRFWESGLRVCYYPPLKVKYEGDRKSTLGKGKFIPFSFNKYSRMHIKNYSIFLIENGSKFKNVSRNIF